MSEPTTKRGREFLSWWQGRHHVTVTLDYADVMVELIEREAVAQERARLRAAVEGLGDCSPLAESPETIIEYGEGYCDGLFAGRSQVLRLLDPEAEGGTE